MFDRNTIFIYGSVQLNSINTDGDFLQCEGTQASRIIQFYHASAAKLITGNGAALIAVAAGGS